MITPLHPQAGSLERVVVTGCGELGEVRLASVQLAEFVAKACGSLKVCVCVRMGGQAGG